MPVQRGLLTLSTSTFPFTKHPPSHSYTNMPSRVWPNGVSVPLTTPFKADESVDHDALAQQVVRLAKAGVRIVLLGTNGEGECRAKEIRGSSG